MAEILRKIVRITQFSYLVTSPNKHTVIVSRKIKMAASIRHVSTMKMCKQRHLLCALNSSLTYCKTLSIVRHIKTQGTAVGSTIISKESKIDKNVVDVLEEKHQGISGYIKYRYHPGVMRRLNTQLPGQLLKAVMILLEKYPVSDLSTKAEKLVRHLQGRQPPLSEKELTIKAQEIEKKLLAKENIQLSDLSDDEVAIALKAHQKKVLNLLRKTVYHWKPMQFDAFTCYIYLVGRVVEDFSVLMQCFTEISKRDEGFEPGSIYNFGSKVGACAWAADSIWKTIKEYYCVDSSGHMNTLARLLLQGGNEQGMAPFIPGVYFRQFPPSPKENKFSIVVSAYMLMEEASAKERLQLVSDLWEMTDTYLVLVENGTTAGFTLIDEAREHILQLDNTSDCGDLQGYVFAPCPHDKACPKLKIKQQPCLTECVMKEIDFSKGKETKKTARYSYVIFKKGSRASEVAWPRVLQHAKASKHTHVHLCLPSGDMQQVVITKGKFDKHLYGCSKFITQGDQFPVSLSCSTLPIDKDLLHKKQTSDSKAE